VRVCSIDLFNIRNEEEFYSAYAREVIRSTSNKTGEWLTMGKRFLKRISPKFSFGIDPVNDFEMSFEMKNAAEDLKELLDLPERIAKSKRLHLVICIDEFQNMANFSEPTLFQKRLRSAWQHHSHVTYCLYGSRRSMLMHLFENRSMPFYKFGEVMYLDKIGKDDLVQFIVDRFRSSGKSIKPGFAGEIADLVQCHPYYVQQLSHITWINTQRGVTKEILEASVEDLINQNSIVYQKETDELSNTQVNFLRALSQGINEQLSSQEVIRKYNLGTSANVNKIKDALDQKEIIDTTGKRTDFLDPAYKLWFQRVYNRGKGVPAK
jgi:hypothetical protein